MRLGLLGGSFDPPHLGHLHVARAAHDALDLDRVLLIPAARPPHKLGRVLASDEDRVAMTGLLARAEPWLQVDRRELSRGGTSYTYDTLAEICRDLSNPGDEIFFLLGSDSLVDLPTWHRAAELVTLATIVTVPRDPASLELGRAQVRLALPAAAERILEHVLDVEPMEISSSGIRARARAGQPIDELVPRAVADYLRAHRLYREPGTATAS